VNVRFITVLSRLTSTITALTEVFLTNWDCARRRHIGRYEHCGSNKLIACSFAVGGLLQFNDVSVRVLEVERESITARSEINRGLPLRRHALLLEVPHDF